MIWFRRILAVVHVAAERSTARGGGLLSPSAFFPFFVGVALAAFALSSIAAALWVVPRGEPVRERNVGRPRPDPPRPGG